MLQKMEGVSDFIRDQIRTSAALNQRFLEAEEHVRNTWRVKALSMVCGLPRGSDADVLCPDTCRV